MEKVSMETVTLQGAPLYYETRGEGQPVVLIHAGVADRRMWDAQWETLATDFLLIRFDLRGYGHSVPPDGPFSYHDDVRGLLDHLGIEQAHIAGVSFGGRTAVDFALAYPERVRSLVLGAPSICGQPDSPDTDAFAEREEALLEAGDLDAASQLNVDFWVVGPARMPDQVDPAVRRAVFEMQRAAFNVSIPLGFEPLSLTPPAYGRLGEIRVPTLILIGDADQPSVQALARKAAAEIPGARLIERKNVGHMVTMERPHEIEAALREFLRSSPGG